VTNIVADYTLWGAAAENSRTGEMARLSPPAASPEPRSSRPVIWTWIREQSSWVIEAARVRLPRCIWVPIAVFIALRLGLSIWMVAVRTVYDRPLAPDPIVRPYLGVAVESNPWLDVWQRWDTLHYQAIAERGYAAFYGALFTPPLFPFLMRAIGWILGGRTLLAGILISNGACIGAFIAMYQFVELENGRQDHATRSVIYLASYPAAFFLLAAYTESLFLLAALVTLLRLRQERWWEAGLWGAVAALTRLPGALIIIPIGMSVIQAWRRERKIRAWAALVVCAAGAVAFPLYVWLVLHLPPWAPLQAQAARFGGGAALPGINIVEAVRRLIGGHFFVADVLDLASILIFLSLTVPVLRKLSAVSGVYYLAFQFLYLARSASPEPLLGMSRYVLALFPAFVVLAGWGRHGWFQRI
jgi:hypothetical protein